MWQDRFAILFILTTPTKVDDLWSQNQSATRLQLHSRALKSRFTEDGAPAVALLARSQGSHQK